MKADLLRKEVETSFRLGRSAKIRLRYATENGIRDIEQELVSRILCKEWNQVTAEDWAFVGSLGVASRLITPEAMAYYVPSLLIKSLDDHEFMDFALEAFVPTNEKRFPRGEWWPQYMASFTSEQKSVIRAFLDYANSVSPEGSAAHYLSNDAIELWRRIEA